MYARINKLINWNGKEYAHIIENEPAPFCDLCVFGDICQKVLIKELAYEDSPMKICNDVCEKANNTHYAFFIDSSKAGNYCNKVNNK